jgi:hypothetical protein
MGRCVQGRASSRMTRAGPFRRGRMSSGPQARGIVLPRLVFVLSSGAASGERLPQGTALGRVRVGRIRQPYKVTKLVAGLDCVTLSTAAGLSVHRPARASDFVKLDGLCRAGTSSIPVGARRALTSLPPLAMNSPQSQAGAAGFAEFPPAVGLTSLRSGQLAGFRYATPLSVGSWNLCPPHAGQRHTTQAKRRPCHVRPLSRPPNPHPSPASRSDAARHPGAAPEDATATTRGKPPQ